MPSQVSCGSGISRGSDFSAPAFSSNIGSVAAPFTPTSISGLRVWLDATDPTTINAGSPVDGDHIATWTDKSSNAFSFAQGTDALRPIYKTNIVNGKSIARASSSLIGANIGADLTTFTLFAVVNVTTFRQFDAILSSNTQGAGQMTLELGATSQFDCWKTGTGAFMSTGLGSAPTGTWLRLCVTYASGAGTFYINNVSAATTNTAGLFIESANCNLFDDGAAGFTNWRGDCAMVLIYDSVLSAANLLNVDNYIKTQLGL